VSIFYNHLVSLLILDTLNQFVDPVLKTPPNT